MRDLIAPATQMFFDGAASMLGPDAVTRAPDTLREMACCTNGSSRKIPGAVYPGSVQQVQEVTRLAREHRIPLYPVSGGHNWGYGTANPVTDGCVLVCLSRMQRIDVDPELGLATVEPGVTQGDFAAYLDLHGLPFLVPTTGAGPQAVSWATHWKGVTGSRRSPIILVPVMGLEAVLPDGSIYRSPLLPLGTFAGRRRVQVGHWTIS